MRHRTMPHANSWYVGLTIINCFSPCSLCLCGSALTFSVFSLALGKHTPVPAFDYFLVAEREYLGFHFG